MNREKNPLTDFDASVMEITCPGCGEKIVPADIEVYPRCPYCDYQFKTDGPFEDFILSPLLRRWVVTTAQRFIR